MAKPESLFRQRKNEQFKPVPGFKGKYVLSNHGRALNTFSNRLMKPIVRQFFKKNGDLRIGTLQIDLSHDGKRQMLTLARMVCFLFVKRFDLTDRKLVVQFRDGNAENCRASNLYLDTFSEALKTQYKDPGRRNNFRDLAKKVTQYDLEGNFVAKYSSAVEASAATEALRHTINAAARSGGTKPASGYYWIYNGAKRKINVRKFTRKVK